MSRPVHLPALLLSLALFVGCRGERVAPVTFELSASPPAVSFGAVIAGSHRELEVVVSNTGDIEAEVRAAELSGPFSLAVTPSNFPLGAVPLTVVFSPRSTGDLQGAVTFRFDEERSLTIALDGVGLPHICQSTDPCITAEVDQNGFCRVRPKADGTACAQRCLTDGQCLDGVCRGGAPKCDDGNPCTNDFCSEDGGCITAPRACPGDGPCKAGLCNPDSGCGLFVVEDGTHCGQKWTCDEVTVCVGGECVSRDPPDGYACWETPCLQGACVGSECRYDAGAGGNFGALEVVAVRDGGYRTGSERRAYSRDGVLARWRPPGDVGSAMPVEFLHRSGARAMSALDAFDCLFLAEDLLCLTPQSATAALVSVDPGTGRERWRQALRPHLPTDRPPTQVVMTASARELALLVETETPDGGVRCRQFEVLRFPPDGGDPSVTPLAHPDLPKCAPSDPRYPYRQPHVHAAFASLTSDGTLLATFGAEHDQWSGLLIPDGPIAEGGGSLVEVALRPDGEVLWTRTPAPDELAQATYAVDGRVYGHFLGDQLVRDLTTGAPLFALPPSLNTRAWTARIGASRIFDHDYGLGALHALDARDGGRLWTSPWGSDDISSYEQLPSTVVDLLGEPHHLALIPGGATSESKTTTVFRFLDAATGTKERRCRANVAASSFDTEIFVANGRVLLLSERSGHETELATPGITPPASESWTRPEGNSRRTRSAAP